MQLANTIWIMYFLIILQYLEIVIFGYNFTVLLIMKNSKYLDNIRRNGWNSQLCKKIFAKLKLKTLIQDYDAHSMTSLRQPIDARRNSDPAVLATLTTSAPITQSAATLEKKPRRRFFGVNSSTTSEDDVKKGKRQISNFTLSLVWEFAFPHFCDWKWWISVTE